VDQRVNHFTEKDVRFLEPIAASAAIAIENARLYAMEQQEVAERKRAEEALQKANESKDKFFSIISHDLKNAFTILLGYTETLLAFLDTYSQDELREDLETIQSTTQQLYGLLENLLTWSRLQRGIMSYAPKEITLQEIATTNLNLFLPKAELKQISLTHTIQDETRVYADVNMVDAVIRNLVSNALKFTHPGGKVEISAQQQDDKYIAVSVSDTGQGIHEEELPKLFRVDMKSSQEGTAGEQGTGLGLPLCKDLVEKSGGSIWATSELEKGTIFTFTLPQIPQ
jgi:signal transduction histidine kinase